VFGGRGLTEVENLGVAVDVGTTTIALHLIDMETGKKLETVGRLNAQSSYGADVTSRLSYCAEFGNELLTRLIREQISSMILEACELSRKQTKNIVSLSIAANTVMQHLVAGYSPVKMGVAPFTPVSLFGEELPAWENLSVHEKTSIYYTPAISAYVGGDVTAGLLAASFEDIKYPALFIDIGTNGEIVLKHNGTYYCCATAAGPAFEGAEITKGMAAINGAISHVKWENGIKRSVIGGGTPQGLCGSGLLDVLALLLETEAVDKTGRLLVADEVKHPVSAYLCEIGGEKAFCVSDKDNSIFITAGDIRKLQLAKAAIAAGIQVLLHYAGIPETEVKLLALAGGFGSYMDLNSAAKIGLFPKKLLPVAKAYGNTAGEGAVLGLVQKDAKKRLDGVRDKCEYIDLSANAFFNDKFVEQMKF